uniref:C-type lectin domain-containing protein n=1 Tax=Oncorhynchus kisutch TaxID=8019 RepID=A0A8C7MJT8_ONCKI
MWTRYSNLTFHPHSVHHVKFVLTNQYNIFGCIRFQLSKTVVENPIMQTMDIDDDTSPNKPSVTFSANFQWWKRPSGVAAVCLGLLCVLLLAGILGLFVYYGVIDHHYSTERDQQTSYSLLTKEGDQQPNSYHNLTKEEDHLQTSYNTLTKERDQFQKEKDQIQTSYNTLTKERDQLQRSYNTLTKERDQLHTSYNTLTKERDQLQSSYNTLTEERDQLQSSYNNLTEERDQLQSSYNNLTEERDQLQNSLTTKKKPCLDGWWKFGTSCYFLSSTMKGAASGQKECRTIGADLVIINSREEQVIDNTLVIL